MHILHLILVSHMVEIVLCSCYYTMHLDIYECSRRVFSLCWMQNCLWLLTKSDESKTLDIILYFVVLNVLLNFMIQITFSGQDELQFAPLSYLAYKLVKFDPLCRSDESCIISKHTLFLLEKSEDMCSFHF